MKDIFSELHLSREIRENMTKLGFSKLTAIQELCLPPLLCGEDLIGQAPTGTGKTLGFAVPILEKLKLESMPIQALVICPTRELCTQIATEMRKLGRVKKQLRIAVITGGRTVWAQKHDLHTNPHIVVGTPGRILDLLDRGSLCFDGVRHLVIDEADRMFDMGFIDSLTRIVEAIPHKRQTVMFSATISDEVRKLSQRFQKKETKWVKVGEDAVSLPSTIRQYARETAPEQKLEALCEFLTHLGTRSALIFCNTKASAEELAQNLMKRGLPADRMHGDMMQERRVRVLAKFRNGSVKMLVATDVAARGIDVEGLDSVINYELPFQPEVYLHRIGRSGRAGREGCAMSFLTPQERYRYDRIETFFEKAGSAFDINHVTGQGQPDFMVKTEKSQPQASFDTLCIGAGRKQKLRPCDILGALTGDVGRLNRDHVGKIEIQDHQSFVAVSSKVARGAMKRLREGRIKGRRFEITMV